MRSLLVITCPLILCPNLMARDIHLTPVHVIQSDTVMNTPEEIKIERDQMFVSLRGTPTGTDRKSRSHSGIAAWDIRRVEAPELLFLFSHPDLQGAMDHILIGQTLFVQSLYNATLFSIDLTYPSGPRLLSTLKLGGDQAIAYRLFKMPDRESLVVSIFHSRKGPTGRLALVDISDPASLRLVTETTELGSWSYDNHAINNAIYSFPYKIGNGKLNIYKLDHGNEMHFCRSFVDPLLDGVHCHQFGDQLIVANFGTASIMVLDIQDPFNPKPIGRLSDSRLGQPNRIAPDFEHNLLWVAGFRKNTIAVVDVENRTELQFVKPFSHKLFSVVQTVAYYQGYLFVGSRNSNSTIVFRVEIREHEGGSHL